MATYAAVIVALAMQDDDNEPISKEDVQNALMASAIIKAIEGEEKSRIRGYVEEVVPFYTDEDFRRMFRMKPATFHSFMEHVKEFPELQPAGAGRSDPISIEKQILIALWYVGGTDTIRKIADRFGVSESTVIGCRGKVLAAILKLRKKFITWPNAEELQHQEQEFERRNGFPGIVGAIDGTHIAIKAPNKNPQRYFNRKHFHSIQLQCVYMHNMQFSHVFVGYPGSVHDSRVLQNSDLWEDGLLKCNNMHHILGDAAYPLRKWLLTPYLDNGHLSPQQKKYNHSSNRVVIERSFALLKSRFRRLHMIDTASVSTAVEIIMACCILHNICLLENDVFNEDLAEDNDIVGNNAIFQELNGEGVFKREQNHKKFSLKG